jgi:hypothetical protein
MPLDKDSFLSRLRHYREEDRHECNLINARMGWLITGQSFLITAFAITANNSDAWFRMGSTIALFVTAEYFARKLSCALLQAELVIYDWHAKEAELAAEVSRVADVELRTELESYFIGRNWKKQGEDEDQRHKKSFEFQRRIYWVFLLIWIGLLIVSCVQNGRGWVIEWLKQAVTR